MSTLNLLHTADWHLGKKLGRFGRLAEQAWVLERLVELAEREAIHAVLLAGDIYDSSNPSPEAEALFAQITVRLAKGGERPVICLAGNHDSAERLDALRSWGAPLGILMIGSLSSAYCPSRLGYAELRWFFPPPVSFSDQLREQNSTPGSFVGAVEIQHPAWPFPLRLILSPYVSPYRLPPIEIPFESWMKERWMEALAAFPEPRAPTLLLTHVYVCSEHELELEEDSEEKSLRVGGLQGFPLSAFPDGIDYVALGHIHRTKVFSHKIPIVYSGSILQYSFDDPPQDKKVIKVEIEAQGSAEYKVSLYEHSLFDASTTKPLLIQKRATTYEEAQNLVQLYKEHYLKLIWEGTHMLSPEEMRKLNEQHEKLILDFQPLARIAGLANSSSNEDLTRTSLEEVFRAYYKEVNQGREPYDQLMEVFREVLERARQLSLSDAAEEA
ncbi:MAG: exonuclease subunit SbcD [Bacteroidia bacterium]|nr:exonuclease subunit SbcD [Bacteroidia bacterium]